MLTVEGPPYFLGKLSGGCLLMALLSPAPTSSFLYSSDVVIPFPWTPFYPHGFTALMLRVGAISYPYQKNSPFLNFAFPGCDSCTCSQGRGGQNTFCFFQVLDKIGLSPFFPWKFLLYSKHRPAYKFQPFPGGTNSLSTYRHREAQWGLIT